MRRTDHYSPERVGTAPVTPWLDPGGDRRGPPLSLPRDLTSENEIRTVRNRDTGICSRKG